MWHIFEHKTISKQCKKAPQQVLNKYELWKNLVFRHGPDILKEFPGFNDEKLQGKRKDQRSSRLSLKYRVVYSVSDEEISVHVLEITPHDY